MSLRHSKERKTEREQSFSCEKTRQTLRLRIKQEKYQQGQKGIRVSQYLIVHANGYLIRGELQ
jgi:hypothetical protein